MWHFQAYQCTISWTTLKVLAVATLYLASDYDVELTSPAVNEHNHSDIAPETFTSIKAK